MHNNLCAELIDIIRGFYERTPEKYLASIDKRIKSVSRFVNMLHTNKIECNDVEDALKYAISMIERI